MLDKEQGAAEIVEEIVTRASDLLNVPSAPVQNR
jgi:hypothetical protein